MKILKKGGLEYVDEGQGEVIVFFHGWGVTPHSYQSLINRLSVKYRVIAPFIDDYSKFEREAGEIVKLLDGEKIDKVVIIGHSAGGTCALTFVSDFPSKIKALVLVNSMGNGRSEPLVIWVMRWVAYSLRYGRLDRVTMFILNDALLFLLIYFELQLRIAGGTRCRGPAPLATPKRRGPMGRAADQCTGIGEQRDIRHIAASTARW